MPIRRELRAFYGPDWRKLRRELIRLRGNACSICGRECGRYLNLSHTTHDPLTSSLRLLCAGCHSRVDGPHRKLVIRRNRASRYGQLWLSAAIEFAPHPWLAPAGVFEPVQEKLFP